MPVYTAISNALVAVGAYPFATTVQALRDNIDASFVDAQIFTASGTWVKPTNLPANAIVMGQIWGGGGSGGRGGGTSNTGGGGGGGGCVHFSFRASDLAATEAVTIGAGGAAVSSAGDGNPGGSSSFNGVTAYGGAGGKGNRLPGSQDGVGGGSWSGIGGAGAGRHDDGGIEVYPDAFGGGCGNYGATSTVGALWGGGGGYTSAGGGVFTSKFGGNGATVDSGAGSAPGGGGGGRGSLSGSSGAGARGEVRIYTIW